MIPLIVSGAACVASDVIDAWKNHAENIAMTKAANSADFQASLKVAATKLAAAAEQQKEKALPADLQTVTQEILQAPDIQSMAHSNPSPAVNLEFNSKGELFTPQVGGGLRQILVAPDVQQQLQELNGLMRSGNPGTYQGGAHIQAQIASIHLPVQVNLAAV